MAVGREWFNPHKFIMTKTIAILVQLLTAFTCWPNGQAFFILAQTIYKNLYRIKKMQTAYTKI